MRTFPKRSKWRAYNLRRKRLPWYATKEAAQAAADELATEEITFA